MEKIILRMDDVGASSKQFEVYSKRLIGNFLFLKFAPPFKAWGQYAELDNAQWRTILATLARYQAKMTVSITASWVEKDGRLTPFPKKFPKEAQMIKEGIKEGFLEIANHGLTHCIVGKHLPRLFFSNRQYHREFYPWLGGEIHENHLKRSQEILENYFQVKVVTFVPPGGVWSKKTEKMAFKFGLRYLCALKRHAPRSQKLRYLIYISDERSFSFHDREINLYGPQWLGEKIKGLVEKGFYPTTVKDFAKEIT